MNTKQKQYKHDSLSCTIKPTWCTIYQSLHVSGNNEGYSKINLRLADKKNTK